MSLSAAGIGQVGRISETFALLSRGGSWHLKEEDNPAKGRYNNSDDDFAVNNN